MWLRRQIVGRIAEGPLTGAAIIQSLAARGVDDRLAGPASVYPMLRLLTEMGVLVESRNPAGHVVYGLVPEHADLPEAGTADARWCRGGHRHRTRCADRSDRAPLSEEG
ncbi:MAG: hypothetical protein U1E45_14705 [Geminicoccaceae bacterium]